MLDIKDVSFQLSLAFFDKKSTYTEIRNNSNAVSNNQQSERGLYSFLRENIWHADLGNMQLIIKYHKQIQFL